MSQAYGRYLQKNTSRGHSVTIFILTLLVLTSLSVWFLSQQQTKAVNCGERRASANRLRAKKEKTIFLIDPRVQKGVWNHLMGRGEREESVVIRIPCKSSHTTLGGLQSDCIWFLCQHQHSEGSRTVYLKGIWRFVRVACRVLGPGFEQDVWTLSPLCYPPPPQAPHQTRPICSSVRSRKNSRFTRKLCFRKISV